MSRQQTSPGPRAARHRQRPSLRSSSIRVLSPWSLGALLIAAVVLMPILSVIWTAAWPENNIWPHLVATTLPRGNPQVDVVPGGLNVDDPEQDGPTVIASASVEAFLDVEAGDWQISPQNHEPSDG